MTRLESLPLVLAIAWLVSETQLFAQQASHPTPPQFSAQPSDYNKNHSLSSCDEQEDDDSEDSPTANLRQLQRYAERLERSKNRLDEQRANVVARAQLVKEAIDFQKEALELTEQIERAENDGDDDRIEKLEEQFERVELQLESRQGQIELLSGIVELKQIANEALDERQSSRRSIAQAMVTKLKSQINRLKQMPDILLNGSEKEVVRFERDLETQGKFIDFGWEVLELQVEVAEAREDEDEERLRELNQELSAAMKKLAGELLTPDPRHPKRQTPDNSNDGAARLPGPIVVTAKLLSAAKHLTFKEHAIPLLKKNCGSCHGDESEEGNLNVDELVVQFPLVKHRSKWNNIIEQLKNRVMPPADSSELDDKDRTQLVTLLHREIHMFDYSKVDHPGFEPIRRLSHEQYNNTVRDLLGIDFRPSDAFPQDLSGSSGFDNSANTLFIQPILMEQYLSAAESITNKAFSSVEDARIWNRLAGAIVRTPKTDASAERILRLFFERAFRRAITSDEAARLIGFYRSARKSGKSHALAAIDAVQVTLVSPSFLLHAETTLAAENSTAVTNRDLANRLSYFLWASMPDQDLTSRSKHVQFASDKSLINETRRMLANQKANTLGTIFAAQWLGFDDLGKRVRADPIDNPWCTESLLASMKEESSMFFMSVLRDNQSIAQLIDADYTFLNAELAQHYRISNIRGEKMRRVLLGKDSSRGGIFGQASLLATTSFPGRTSPVVRGKWILADVLGTPPPPPPPNVSELSEAIERKRNLSMKEKLELHRRKANCFACHSQMDPLGFSLQRFDWFGRERSRRQSIDEQAELPNGTKFTGPAGLKRVIVEQRLDDLTTQLTRKMLSYALGRQLEYYDEKAVQEIVNDVKEDKYRMQTLIEGVVLSYPFRFKRKSD